MFITRLEAGKTINEGICLKCARELGITQVNSIIEKMGLSDEDLDRMDAEIDGLVESAENEDGAPETDDGEKTDEGRAPAVDFRKMFGPIIGRQPPMGAPGAPGTGIPGKDRKKAEANQKRKYLDAYCRDVTKAARENRLDRVIGRDRELARLIQILSRRQKNNPCLIGEPGVGKTAIAEALAQKIVAGDVPYRLKNKEVHSLDLTSLVAGTQFRGQFESRIKGLIEEIKALGNIILVIDEVHSIVGAGDAEGSMNAANILKPALSKGEVQVIGATTLAEYRKFIEKDTALERRFQPIIVEEPSVADTVEILRGIKNYYEQFHGIKIPDETVVRAVTLSERYITERFLPDKAIDLLDEASAYLALNTPLISRTEELADEIKKTDAAIEKAEAELSKGEGNEDSNEEKYKTLADLKVKQINDRAEFDRLSAARDGVTLETDHLAKVIEVWTGIPAGNITQNEFERVDRLGDRLKKRVIGQDKAVDAVARAIKRGRAGVSAKRKPVSFIFAGPTGVGKTELVKQLAADLFDSPETLIRLDMSEFMEKHTVSRIIGAPPGYVGFDEAGQLTEKIRRKPYSVVLFDEIEKAHPDVLNILLQILDDGRVTDAQGRTVNFENTVIVMTTNAGSNTTAGAAGFGASRDEQNEDKTMKALGEFLRPEFINRVDEIVVFRSLEEDDFSSIAAIMIGDMAAALGEKGIDVSWTAEAEKCVAKKSYSRRFGARNMRRYVQKNIEDVIAGYIISSYGDPVKEVRITTVPGENGEDELSIVCAGAAAIPAICPPSDSTVG